MINLISNHPSVIDIHTVVLNVLIEKKGEKEKIRFIDTNTKESWEKIVSEDGNPIPNGILGIKVISFIKKIHDENWEKLPENLIKSKILSYEIYIRLNWKDLQDYSEINCKFDESESKIEFRLYADFPTVNVYDENGYIDYLSKPFIEFFKQFKIMFHEHWPNKYLLLPYDNDTLLNNKKSKLLQKLRNTFISSSYYKIDKFF